MGTLPQTWISKDRGPPAWACMLDMAFCCSLGEAYDEFMELKEQAHKEMKQSFKD